MNRRTNQIRYAVRSLTGLPKRILWPGITLVLLSVALQAASSAPEHFLAVRVMGLTRHLIRVTDNAPYFPMRLDPRGAYVFNPGVLVSVDTSLPRTQCLFWRNVHAFYLDCATQPAFYIASMIFHPRVVEVGKTRVGGGLGIGFNMRRNWQRFAEPGIRSQILKQTGNFETIFGPYCEIEMARLINHNLEWVSNFIPGLPVLVFFSSGVRVRL